MAIGYFIISIALAAFMLIMGIRFIKDQGECFVKDDSGETVEGKSCSSICSDDKCTSEDYKHMAWKSAYLYYGQTSSNTQNFLLFLTDYISVANLIPVVVFVMYEFMNFDYVRITFNPDVEIWDEEKATKCVMNNMGVLEDLALVDYMFCDKTGTLTKNELIFREMKLIDQDVP